MVWLCIIARSAVDKLIMPITVEDYGGYPDHFERGLYAIEPCIVFVDAKIAVLMRGSDFHSNLL